MQRIVIAQADDQALSARADELLLDGYEPITALSADRTRHHLAHALPDALVLGQLATPAESLQLLRELRGGEIPPADSRLPAISIGADTDHSAVRHYQAGADIALPSTASALLVKHGIDAVCFRTGHPRPRRLQVGDLSIDCDARIATINHAPLGLTRLEFDVLRTLASQPRKVFTRQELYQEVWGYDPALNPLTRTIDSHVGRVRIALRDNGAPDMLHGVRGVGYRLT